jgi:hypothetical protein
MLRADTLIFISPVDCVYMHDDDGGDYRYARDGGL